MTCDLLVEEDNDSFVLGEESLRVPESSPGFKHRRWIIAEGGGPHPRVCAMCGGVQSRYPIQRFKLRKKEFDFSGTHDGYLVVSSKMKSFLESEFALELFLEIPGQAGFFIFDHFQLPIVSVDREESGVRESELCPTCGEPYYQLFGRIPGRPPKIRPLVFNEAVSSLARSDMEFGSTHGRAPVVVASAEASKMLRAQDFKGLTFTEAQCPG